MEFLWLWAFSLKTPISILCALSIVACFLSWLSAKSQKRDQSTFVLNIAVISAIIWAIVYSLPSPTYNVQTVIKEVPKPYPVVRKYVAQRQVLTRTITVHYTQDEMYNKCMDGRSPAENDNVNFCSNFSKSYMQPRIIVRQVKVPVYSGVQVRIVEPSRDARVKWCVDNTRDNVDACTDWAKKMEQPSTVQVRVEHDPFLKLFQECNNVGVIDKDEKGGGANVRNERIKICTDMAQRGSR